MASAEQRSPFGPAPLQSLLPYYELLRPCAPLWYSGPCGVCRLDVSLGIGATGSHVPYKSLVELRAADMPDAARAGFRVLPSCSRGTPRFRHRLIGFRHVISGSLALASLNLACRDQVPTFPQRCRVGPGSFTPSRSQIRTGHSRVIRLVPPTEGCRLPLRIGAPPVASWLTPNVGDLPP